MFLDADELHLKGEISSALKLYEKFSKRRSDFILTKDGSSVLVGPEALYRASLREKTRVIGKMHLTTLNWLRLHTQGMILNGLLNLY